MIRIKFCGLTRLRDVKTAAELGIDCIGFVFAKSKRQLSPLAIRDLVAATPNGIETIGVFMDQPLEFVLEATAVSGIDTVQLHGRESAEFCERCAHPVLKRISVNSGDSPDQLERRIASYPAAALLLDPGAGDGETFDPSCAAQLSRPFMLAGGLSPDNVAQAIRVAHPAGVDVSSGIESAPGIKDPNKMQRFVAAVRGTDVQRSA